MESEKKNEFTISVNPIGMNGFQGDGYCLFDCNCMFWRFQQNHKRSYGPIQGVAGPHDGPIPSWPYTTNYPYYWKPHMHFLQWVNSGRPINQSTGELPTSNRSWRQETLFAFGPGGVRMTDQVVPGVTSMAAYNDGSATAAYPNGEPDPPQHRVSEIE